MNKPRAMQLSNLCPNNTGVCLQDSQDAFNFVGKVIPLFYISRLHSRLVFPYSIASFPKCVLLVNIKIMGSMLYFYCLVNESILTCDNRLNTSFPIKFLLTSNSSYHRFIENISCVKHQKFCTTMTEK